MTAFSEKKVDRLLKAYEYSSRRLRPIREHRKHAVKQYVGTHYSDNGASRKVPVNYIEQGVNIYSRYLVAQEPKVLISTKHMELKPIAATFETAMNHLIRNEIPFADTLKAAVIDALFCVGIVKVGIKYSRTEEVYGFTHDLGQPYADVVDLDDWCHDMVATRWDQIEFCGNRYRIPLSDAKKIKSFKAPVREKLTSTARSMTTSTGDQKTAVLEKGEDSQPEEYSEKVELVDLWLPQENLVVTLPTDGPREVLRVTEWDGPEKGPFHILGFGYVPGNNLMPLSPVSQWMDMHEILNVVWRKMGRTAEREKTVLGYSGSNAEEALRVKNSSDGEVIMMDRPNEAREYHYGGVNPNSMQFAMQGGNVLSWIGGNFDTLGGLSTQADTATQEQMLSASSSRRVQDMQDSVQKYARNILKGLGYYIWNDPLLTMPLTKRLPGLSYEIEEEFTPEMRENDFMEYNIEIEPYSMQHDSPAKKLQNLNQLVQGVLLPMAQMLQGQGISINFEGLLKNYARYANMSDLEELITISEPLFPDQGPVGTPPQKPPFTQRTNYRVNVPGNGKAGEEQIMQMMLAAGQGKMGAQPSQVASLGRA